MNTYKLYHLNMIATIIGVIIFSAFIIGYHYSGVEYYIQIDNPSKISPINFPISNTLLISYEYKGIARDSSGKPRQMKFNTIQIKGTNLKSGEIIRLTYNKYYGVVRYKQISRKSVPKKARLKGIY